MTGIFLVAGASEVVFLLAPYTSRAGAVWTDVIWCAPFLLATVIAATWNREEESVSPIVSSRFRTIIVSQALDRKSTRLNSSHQIISYAVFCLKKKKQYIHSIH